MAQPGPAESASGVPADSSGSQPGQVLRDPRGVGTTGVVIDGSTLQRSRVLGLVWTAPGCAPAISRAFISWRLAEPMFVRSWRRDATGSHPVDAGQMRNRISLVQYNADVGSNTPKRRQRQPRVRDNPMARIAHKVMVEAEQEFRRAEMLAAGMEPHLLKRVNDSAIYGYTNDRPDRNVPPGDVLLAAALAAGISIDQKLGMARQANDMDELRAQVAEMREQMANLQAQLALTGGAPAGPAADRDRGRAERAAQRLAWARRSEGGPPPSQPIPSARRSGRGSRP